MEKTRFQERFGRTPNETDIAPKHSCLKIPLDRLYGYSRAFAVKGDSISVLSLKNFILNDPTADPNVYIAFNKADSDRIPLVEGMLLTTEFERFYLFNEIQEPGTSIRLSVGTDFQGHPPVAEELLRSGVATLQILVGQIAPVLISTGLIVPVRHMSVTYTAVGAETLWLGDATVTNLTGYPVASATHMWFDKLAGVQIYGIALGADITICVMELA